MADIKSASGGTDEEVVQIKLMKIEAEAAVREISFAVESVDISSTLQTTDDQAYMNIRTKEGAEFCVELTVQGYRIVGNGFNHTTDTTTDGTYYETIYALLDTHSPKYRLTFGETLAGKLESLRQFQGEGDLECKDTEVGNGQ